VFELIPSGQVFDIGGQLFPLLAEKGLPFYAQSRWFNWIDIGRVTDYWAVCQRVLRGEVAQMDMPGREVRPGVWVGLNTRIDFDQVNITGPCYIGSSSEVEPGATIVGPAWLGNGCVLREGSTLIRSILFDYTRLSQGETLEDMITTNVEIYKKINDDPNFGALFREFMFTKLASAISRSAELGRPVKLSELKRYAK